MLAISPLLLLFIAHTGVARTSRDATSSEATSLVALSDQKLSFELQAFTDIVPVAQAPKHGALGWDAKFEEQDVRIELRQFEHTKYGFHEPEDAVEAARTDWIADNESQRFAFDALRVVRTNAGAAPFLARTHSSSRDDGKTGETFIYGGWIDHVAWSLTIYIESELALEARARVESDVERSVRWSGKLRNPRWADAEAKAFFDAHASESARRDRLKPIQTEHFLVLSTHRSADQYAKRLEAWYSDISAILPLEDSKYRRLLPVLLLRQQREYTECLKEFAGEDVSDSSGGSWGVPSVYVTHFDFGNETKIRSDLTWYILVNRLRSNGGSWWFMSGLRRYCSTGRVEREDAARAVRKRKHTPLAKLLDWRAWNDVSDNSRLTGVSAEVSYWDQSALWMEFLHRSKWTKAKFPHFVRAMSAVRKSDVEHAWQTLAATFECDARQLESRYVEYCDARK